MKCLRQTLVKKLITKQEEVKIMQIVSVLKFVKLNKV